MRDIRLYTIRQLKTVMQSMMKSTRHLIIMIFWLKSSDRKMNMEKSWKRKKAKAELVQM